MVNVTNSICASIGIKFILHVLSIFIYLYHVNIYISYFIVAIMFSY